MNLGYIVWDISQINSWLLEFHNAKNYALQNVNLKINNGEHFAVVGKNDSGKTIFIKLMCRLYDVTDGEILINGNNIKEYTWGRNSQRTAEQKRTIQQIMDCSGKILYQLKTKKLTDTNQSTFCFNHYFFWAFFTLLSLLINIFCLQDFRLFPVILVTLLFPPT